MITSIVLTSLVALVFCWLAGVATNGQSAANRNLANRISGPIGAIIGVVIGAIAGLFIGSFAAVIGFSALAGAIAALLGLLAARKGLGPKV